MMPNDFDPYDALIELNERMNRLEQAHNNLARAHQQSERDLNTTLKSLKNLQQHFLIYQEDIRKIILNKMPG